MATQRPSQARERAKRTKSRAAFVQLEFRLKANTLVKPINYNVTAAAVAAATVSLTFHWRAPI